MAEYSAPDAAGQVLAANHGKPAERIAKVEFGQGGEIDAAVVAQRGSILLCSRGDIDPGVE